MQLAGQREAALGLWQRCNVAAAVDPTLHEEANSLIEHTDSHFNTGTCTTSNLLRLFSSLVSYQAHAVGCGVLQFSLHAVILTLLTLSLGTAATKATVHLFSVSDTSSR